MKTKNLLLSVIVLTAMVLTACGGGQETSTFEPATDMPPATQETLESTEMPSGTETQTGDNLTTTPEIPVTGGENPARLSNMLDFNVWNQNGEEIGEVNDMVIDVDTAAITYVIVGTGGFLEIGEKDIAVPWDMLTLQISDGTTTGGQRNAFILQADQEMFNNFPDMDWKSNFPNVGDPANDWDTDIRNYWEGGVVPGGTGAGTATVSPDGTVVPDATSTSAPDVSATATGTTAQGQGQGQGLGTRLQGVVLASDVLGSTLNLSGMMNAGEGQGQQGQATATSDGSAGVQATATSDGSTVPQATATVGTGVGPGTGNVTATVEDVIVDVETGDVQYLVINTSFDDGEHWIPVPLGLLQWNGASENFVLDTNGDRLMNAPFFTEDQFPDTTASGWDDEFSTYWQSDGAGTGGTDGSENATATPTQ